MDHPKLTAGSAAQGQTTSRGLGNLAGKYLTFLLGREEFGLEILKVREIIGLMAITPVPRSPAYVRGVINLRGKIIPVVDLRSKFGMEPLEGDERNCIIVVDLSLGDSGASMGVLVDRVSEVLDIAGEDIDPPPAFGSDVDTQFILGMAKAADRVKILLAIEKVLSRSGEWTLPPATEGAAPAAA